nr:hypothetical protein [Tanacetum cinerariifolium]
MGEIAIRELRKKLEIDQKEKDGIQLNVDKFKHASKSLNKLIECQIVDSCKKRLGYENYNTVPPPYIGNFMPPTHDLSFTGLDEFVNKPVVENYKAKSSKEEPKIVRKNDVALIIEEWMLDNEEEDVSQPKIEKKTVRPRIAKIETKAVVNTIMGNNSNAVKASACWVWKPKHKVLEHVSKHKNALITLKKFYYVGAQGVIDSRCSRNRTGNMSCLIDYEEIDEGYVAFGGNPQRRKITRKGTIKTGNLDFKNVYFVRELKFNPFSVSQVCDKKNSVLFNDIECIVLSPNFKLIYEGQVLLRVPRKNNMYSVDLKNIVPKGGLTCLFAKATSDESKLWHRRLGHLNLKTMNKLVKRNLVRGLPSKLFENDQTYVACLKGKQHRASCKPKTKNLISLPLHLLHMDLFGLTFVKNFKKKMYCLVVTDDYIRFTWVFFLATKDETSGILKSFITRIENLVDHNVKVIRCDNRIEFKNRETNQFCKMKGILRQFSVAKTPQQNRVTERRNETLIEAARTMPADSKLPTTFWAEAVNTACYVQNRVFVVKPHNKTPYEPFHGRTPTLSFMRPFGFLVTIINTIDHLGKFDGKADEGFFVGYSLNSKAFRVFNSRTKIVEENLHIRFSESTPNVVGSGPDWLFDIYALTRTMNYEQIVAGIQSNGFAGTKASDNVDLKSSNNDGSKPSSDDEKKVDKDPRKENKCNDQEKEDNVNNTNNVNTVSLTINTTGTNEVNAIVADMNNLDIIIQVNPIPTTRIHKVHPLDQVIGDLQSATKTRKMLKNLEEHGFVSTIQQRTNHKDLQNCLFACFLSQEEPKKLWSTTIAKTINGKVQLHAQVDGKEIVIIESSVRRDLQLADEEDEAVHKELGNKLVRATTTASNLEAEHDNGGGPRCQETMRDTIAQTRVESSRDEESLGEDASKQERRIDVIDSDKEITLVNDVDNEMFDVDVLGGEEMFVAGQNENVVEEVVDVAQVKGIVFQELGKSTTTTTTIISSQQSQDNGKGIMIEEPVKPKKKDQIRLEEEAAKKLQAKFDEEERLLSDTEKATLFQQHLEKRRKHFVAKRVEEKRNKPQKKAQQRKITCSYLKNMKGYKLKDLKLKEFNSIQEMFDRAFKSVNTFKDSRTELVEGKEKRAGTELEQEITKKQKVEDDKEKAWLK